MDGFHPLAVLLTTFAIGALAGSAFFLGAVWMSPERAALLLDLHGDGLGGKDLLIFAWLFGNAAILFHHILPGILRA